ncbi:MULTISPECIES: Rv1355c family protein [Rhodococcus erythropolis group]|uniref:Rv1355c family protein n=1 Tax=Rhodococcus baikonurensis TaxID=172041 RepID=A0ABV5XFH0_9NOCA|nr:Rv1355c family protein [Rhodococcus qingshengii]MCZ4547150.1 Rv1355c family protein [Rhodococcus qingshengii]
MQEYMAEDGSQATIETTTVRAEVLDDTDPTHLRRVAELRATGVEVLDTLAAQRASLRSLTPAPGELELTETPRWIHYPWRRTVVRLLGPLGFRRLRLDRNRNKITTAEQEQLSQLRIGIVGLSVGSAIAHAIALEGTAGYLRLADFDDLDLSNLNRLSATILDLGVNKAVLAQRRIAEIDPYVRVEAWACGVGEHTIDAFLDGLDLVIEECDSFDVKVLIRDRARRRGIPVVMETSDRGLIDVERYDLDPGRPLFHGLLGDIDSASVAGLSVREKIPFGLRILEGSALSSRMAASVLDVGTALSTWPQLGGDVLLGGASVAAAVRRFGLGEPLPSGRVRIDIGDHLDQLREPHLPQDSTSSAADHTVRTDALDVRFLYDTCTATAAVAFAATRAPSGGNAQPWIIDVNTTGLTLRIDETRSSTVDIEHRGSFVALGAALHNARIAAAHRNILGATEVSGDGTATTARIAFATGTDQQLAAQLPGMLNRVTHRGAPDTDPTSTNLTDLTDLAACLSTETHRIHLIEDRDTIDRLAETISATDRIRFLTDHLHREMIAELRWPDSNDLDTGIEVTSLGTPAAELAVLELLRRPDVMTHLNQWNTGQALRSETTSRLTSSNAIAVVTQTGTSAGDYIRGGALAEEFWIHTQSLGYSVHPMTPLPLYATAEHQLRHLSTDRIDELMALWNELKTLTATTANNPATLILRIFRTTTPAPTSRRRTPHH